MRRLPDRPGAKPLALDVQFAPSLTLHGDDLLIGFGVGDCHSGACIHPLTLYCSPPCVSPSAACACQSSPAFRLTLLLL